MRAAVRAATTRYHQQLRGSVGVRGSLSAKVRTRLMLHWAQIALTQEREAHDTRAELVRTRNEVLGEGKALDLPSELHPSMLAVAAAASALDALYGEVRDDVGISYATQAGWRAKRMPRYTQIHETLKRGFPVKNEWHRELKWLFGGLRDAALHPRTDFDSPEQHPLGVNAAPEYVTYRCENATRAVDLMVDVLVTCAERPRPPLEAWSADARRPIEGLVETRRAFSGP